MMPTDLSGAPENEAFTPKLLISRVQGEKPSAGLNFPAEGQSA